jgi:hypothetical protein
MTACSTCGAAPAQPDNPRGWPASVLADLDEAWPPPTTTEQVAALLTAARENRA